MSKKTCVIAGVLAAAFCVLAIPFADTLIFPGTRYADGFSKAMTYIEAAVLGALFGFGLWRKNRKGKD